MLDADHRRLGRLVPFYVAALVLLVATADGGALDVSFLARVPAADKVGHFVLMGLLSYLLNAALGCRRFCWRRLSLLQGSALTGMIVAIEELSQLWLVHRSFELADLAADLTGIWLFGQWASARQEGSFSSAGLPARGRGAGGGSGG